jgi:ankyrin repeat protein
MSLSAGLTGAVSWQDQYTPLWWAVFNGHVEVAARLVEAKATDVDVQSEVHRI